MTVLKDEETIPASAVGRPFDDLRTSGLLWLINRVVFHPRGFALGFVFHEGELAGWQLQGDGTDPFRYDNDIDERDLMRAAERELGGRPPVAAKRDAAAVAP